LLVGRGNWWVIPGGVWCWCWSSILVWLDLSQLLLLTPDPALVVLGDSTWGSCGVGPPWDLGRCRANRKVVRAVVGPGVWSGAVGYKALCPNRWVLVARIRPSDSVLWFPCVGLPHECGFCWAGVCVGSKGIVWGHVWDQGRGVVWWGAALGVGIEQDWRFKKEGAPGTWV
jgi:hypothetical protein